MYILEKELSLRENKQHQREKIYLRILTVSFVQIRKIEHKADLGIFLLGKKYMKKRTIWNSLKNSR